MPVRVPKSSFDEDIGLKKPSFLVEDIKIMFTRLLAPANGQNFQWDFTFIRLNFICVAARKQVDATLQTRFVHTATKMSMSPLENKVIKSGWNLKSLATIAYKVLLAIATAASMDTPQRKLCNKNTQSVTTPNLLDRYLNQRYHITIESIIDSTANRNIP
jgi:hypothetical protein